MQDDGKTRGRYSSCGNGGNGVRSLISPIPPGPVASKSNRKPLATPVAACLVYWRLLLSFITNCERVFGYYARTPSHALSSKAGTDVDRCPSITSSHIPGILAPPRKASCRRLQPARTTTSQVLKIYHFHEKICTSRSTFCLFCFSQYV